MEKSRMDYFMKKAIRSAAEFNSQFMRERREERRAYFDLQTMVCSGHFVLQVELVL
jgi:hypothetical protein